MTAADHRPDYLIVGAGSAGCVLAARLTEDPSVRVVLLEAGPDYPSTAAPPSVKAVSPIGVLRSSDDARFRWDELKVRRTAQQDAVLLWKGRGTGGSSAVNGMLAVRPEPDDFDSWAAQGCDGWQWSTMLSWFNHIEADALYGHQAWHGDRGPFPVWRPSLEEWGTVERAALDAFQDLGYPYCADHNAPGSTGVGPYAANIRFHRNRTAERVSASSAYLDDARARPNLTILGDVMVDRVLIEQGRAVGVLAQHDGTEQVFEAANTILCAGSPFSPALLLRSGVNLRGLGRRVADHPGLGIQIIYDLDAASPPSNGRHINCFGRYSSRMAGGGANDMAWLAGAHPDPMPDGRYASQVQVALWQPFSAGTITLADSSPRVPPAVASNMLGDARDLVRMRDGFRRLIKVMNHPALASIEGRRSYGRDAVVIDDISDIGNLGNDELDQLLLESVYDTQHLVGGCSMGAGDDELAVVDTECRVRGMDGLRVIDGSILPSCPRANTHFTVLAIAERMAAHLQGATP